MKELMEQWGGSAWPELIRNLPEADVPVPGVTAWLMEGSGRQIVFFDIDQTAEVPPHSHCAQWGMMVEGDMSITIGDKVHRVKNGDWYFIPEGTTHSAVFHSRCFVIDMFDSNDRYKAKA